VHNLPLTEYRLDWVTENIAVGGAPLSYEQLNHIQHQGIHAIINLCGEYCDLHDIERDHGFDVYYLPIADECAPDCQALEQAMEWMDGILKEGKRLLIHCRLGMGRTGTLLYAYLWSRRLDQSVSESLLEGLRSRPCNFDQWRAVRRYQGEACAGSSKHSARERISKFWGKLLSRFRNPFRKQ
jgi:hypothetical protein